MYTVTDVKGVFALYDLRALLPPRSAPSAVTRTHIFPCTIQWYRTNRIYSTDLHEWMASHLRIHPLFVEIPNEELADDPILEAARTSTEEGKKVERNKGDKWVACFRRAEDPVD